MGLIKRLFRMFGKKPVVLPPLEPLEHRLTLPANPILAKRGTHPEYIPPRPFRRSLVVIDKEPVRQPSCDGGANFLTGVLVGELLSTHAHTEESYSPSFTGGGGESSAAGASSSWEPRESDSSSDSFSSSDSSSSSSSD